MEHIMNSVSMQDLYKYKFLSSLEFSPDGGKAAFVVSWCDKDENGYKSDLYLLDGGRVRRLTQGGSVGTYLWKTIRTFSSRPAAPIRKSSTARTAIRSRRFRRI